MPNIMNASVWSAMLAATAIILSQMPPISNWMPNPKLSIMHADKIIIHSDVGNVDYHISLELANKGNIEIDIPKIDLEILSPAGIKKTYTAESYRTHSRDQLSSFSLPFTSINIKEDESWRALFIFTKNIDPSSEEELNNVKFSILQEINVDLDSKKSRNDFSRGVAGKIAVDKAKDYFNKNFSLQKGEYKTKLLVYINKEKDPLIIRSEFIVYDFQIAGIKSLIDDYKYGINDYASNYRNEIRVKFKSRSNRLNEQ